MNHVLKFPAGVVAIDDDGIGRVRLSGESLAALHAQLGKVLGVSAKKPAKPAADATKRAPGQITTRKAWLAAVRGPIAAVEGKYGDRWTLIEGAAVPVRVPAHWVSLAVKGRTIRGPRDIRIPAAEFWPGGRLPGGIEVYQDPPRETRLIADAARERWVKAWMRVNGARLNAEAEELARKEARWRAEDKARASEWEAHKFVTRTVDELDSEYARVERELRVLESRLDYSAKLAREASELADKIAAIDVGESESPVELLEAA